MIISVHIREDTNVWFVNEIDRPEPEAQEMAVGPETLDSTGER